LLHLITENILVSHILSYNAIISRSILLNKKIKIKNVHGVNNDNDNNEIINIIFYVRRNY